MADDATNGKPGAAFDKLRQRPRWLSVSKPVSALAELVEASMVQSSLTVWAIAPRPVAANQNLQSRKPPYGHPICARRRTRT